MIAGIDNAWIQERSYHIWEKAGRPIGRDQEHWFQAEQELKKEMQPAAAPKKRAKKSSSNGATAPKKKATRKTKAG